MQIEVLETPRKMAAAAAEIGARALRAAIERDGAAAIVLASATSQIDMLDCLIDAEDIDWSKVTAFHLDEYIGLPASHPASFRRFLMDRVQARLPTITFRFIGGDAADRRPRRRASAMSSGAFRSPSASSASAKTATWRSTTRRPISPPKNPT